MAWQLQNIAPLASRLLLCASRRVLALFTLTSAIYTLCFDLYRKTK